MPGWLHKEAGHWNQEILERVLAHFPERTSEITDLTSARFKPAFLACFLAFAIRVENSSIEGGEMAFMMTVSLLAITTN